MRIAVVSPYSVDYPGGVQSHARELVGWLRRLGDDAWLVAPGTGSDDGSSRLVGKSLRVPANGSLAPVALDPRVLRRVRVAVAGASVVHVHEPLVPLVAWAAMRVTPTVLTFHADPSPATRRAYRTCAPLLRRVIASASAITAVSPVAAGAIAGFAPEPQIIPNGIDAAAYRPAGVERVPGRVAFLGRDDRRKGLDVLRKAWPGIRAAVPGATARIMGAGGDDGDGLVYLGRVDDATKVNELAAATVFCAPNRGGESFGITLVEGMAAGCAVVAADLPAFRSAAGSAAVFVPVGDSGALAERCVSLLTDAGAAARLGADGRAQSEQYDWAKIVPRYRRLYERVVSEPEPLTGR